MLIFDELTFAQCCFVAAHIRDRDYREWIAETGEPSRAAIAIASFHSSPAHLRWVCLRNGSPIAALGFAPIYPHLASVWAFGTPAADKAFPRIGRFLFTSGRESALKSGIRRAEVRCLDVSRDWIKSLGGTFEAEMREYGVNGETFYLYSWTGG